MNRIVIAGRIGRHQQDRIISTEGICPALTAGSHLNAGWMNLILDEKDESEDIYPGRLQPEHPKGAKSDWRSNNNLGTPGIEERMEDNRGL